MPTAILFDIGLTVIHPSGEVMLAEARAEIPGFDAAPHHLVAALLLAAEARHLPLPLGLDGDGKVAVTWGMLAGLPPETSLKVWRRMMARDDLYCELDAGAVELLRGLRERGIKVGAVSNSDGMLPQELLHFGLAGYFDTVIDSALVSIEKPNPGIFHAALDALDVTAGQCWFVGDGLVNDILGARSIGVGLAVLYDRLEVYGHLPAVAKVHRLDQLLMWLDHIALPGTNREK
ncbi:HAD family hydrolase [Streptomyces sp. NPDC102384]|uniref:HAD family hydrolase n=1 Tax=Streptomyces sp. NPDC102384 TaxID=3366166 RepID=UPI0037F9E01F